MRFRQRESKSKIQNLKSDCERSSNRLSVGLPNRGLRVRFPSLTPKIYRRVVSTGKMSVSKTEVLRSNRGAPANFLTERKNNFPPSLFLTEGKPNRCGSSLENCREQSHIGSSPVPSSNFRGRSSTESEQFVSTEQVRGSNPLALSNVLRLRSSMELERKNTNLEVAGSNPAEVAIFFGVVQLAGRMILAHEIEV